MRNPPEPSHPKRARRFAALGLMSICLAGCESQPAKTAVAARPAAPAAARQVEPADNSYCYVCHVNYQEEALAQPHAQAGIGCETCHGQSAKHSADEDGLTAPERMYAAARVAPFCLTCHEPDKVRQDTNHASVFTSSGTAQCCTDCHGEHRLAHRTRRWDKDTGKLVWKDGGPTMDQSR